MYQPHEMKEPMHQQKISAFASALSLYVIHSIIKEVTYTIIKRFLFPEFFQNLFPDSFFFIL